MSIWRNASTTHPKRGLNHVIFSNNVLVRLDSGVTCIAYYDTLNREWCDALTTRPFLNGEVVEWRDEP